MKAKFNDLIKNITWVWVNPPFNRTIIGSKWIFHVKKLASSLLEKKKPRVVAQGYKQVPGFDFLESFNFVVK